MRTIRRVAVLGAGTMGSRIAAHFANAAFLRCCWMFPDSRIATCPRLQGIQNALKQRPGGFFTEEKAALVQAGNFDDDLDKLSECDWIIEAIVENLDAKRALWQQSGCRAQARLHSFHQYQRHPARQDLRRFLGRIPPPFPGHAFFQSAALSAPDGADTGAGNRSAAFSPTWNNSPTAASAKAWCAPRTRPTSSPTASAAFLGGTIGKAMVEDDFSIEEVDALTGSLIGVPNSASFRLLDLVGLDVWAFVGTNLYELVPNDPWRDRFLPLDFEKKMIEQKWLGDKTGQGFYKRVGKDREIQALDWKTLEYQPLQKPRFAAVEAARNIEDLGERVRTLLRSDDRAGRFLWKVLSDLFLYCAAMIPEISDRIVEIDRAMRWGYGHKLGPFELWDAHRFPGSGLAP